jgi:hypothetical protein
MKASIIERTCLALIIVLAAALAVASPVSAKGPEQQVEHIDGEGRATAKAPVASVTIERKRHQWVITTENDRYQVKHGTVIVDTDGRQVSLRKLRVPCSARIEYQSDQGVRRAHRIKLLSVSSTASTDFTKDMPE